YCPGLLDRQRFASMTRRPPRSPPFPYTTLFRSDIAGLVFRYRHNRDFLFFALTGGTTARIAERLPLETEFRVAAERELAKAPFPDQKSTRLNSSHLVISYAVFCLKKKNIR